ncbi:hypothetical protein ADIAG_00771 [Paeniglutamicibacter gangotriensis Lz1y]|uniref:Uncharacterized protein n=1 Tax=Paeniglutamicibacter gangotriensis Lz1y TaxID=1276920 RepID=M7MX86_9MICC|nr:hypothetical protein ADIAG_00771 [Paeniglutamicibacter gangotriensis Lz1y]
MLFGVGGKIPESGCWDASGDTWFTKAYKQHG